jgi:radical SAM superfamily enzyme YgiQ (UPF0313 family)
MRLQILSPRWPAKSFWGSMFFQFPILSLTTLAALTPPEWEVSISDENVEEIGFDAPPDLVAISAMTPLAPRAYELADRFREVGSQVVLGGYHPTYMPQEALQHADAVGIGEAEGYWGKLLSDVQEGRLQREYRATSRPDRWGWPFPRRDLIKDKPYFFTNTLQTTRGCPFNCEFCAVTTFYGNTYRSRPLDEVEAEIQALEGALNYLVFVDDNIVGNRNYARDLFQRLIPYGKRWLSHATLNLARDPELLALCAQSGCCGLFIGFESLSEANLKEIGKSVNKVGEYEEAVKRLHDVGIGIEGSFVVGYDEDQASVFDRLVEFVKKTKLDGAHFFVRTPFPGTRLYRKLEEQGRIFDRDWSRYDLSHVVFHPRQMSPEALQEGSYRAYHEIYSYPSMIRRLLLPPRKRVQVFGPMNWAFRRACRDGGYF